MKYSKLFLIVLIISTLAGCAFFQKVKTNPEESAVLAYRMAGETIVSSHSIVIALKEQGKLTPEQIAKYNGLLTKTKQAYVLAGESLKLYINASDAVKKKELLLSFQSLASQAGILAVDISNFIIEVTK